MPVAQERARETEVGKPRVGEGQILREEEEGEGGRERKGAERE
jgi:hypothetical protein